LVADTYALIRGAILGRAQVLGWYGGHYREMCPHALGRKRGVRQALFYQFGGTSQSGLGPSGSDANWRCLPVEGLSQVTVRPGPWHTAATSVRRQTCIDQVDVEV